MNRGFPAGDGARGEFGSARVRPENGQPPYAANKELVALMSAKGVAPPKGLAADKKDKLNRLASLPPSAAFDNGYVRVVGIEDHRTNIAIFERARRETKDRDLLAWIDRTLFALRSHLSAAQSLVGTLDG